MIWSGRPRWRPRPPRRRSAARGGRAAEAADRLGLPPTAVLASRDAFSPPGRAGLTAIALALTVATAVSILAMEATLDAGARPRPASADVRGPAPPGAAALPAQPSTPPSARTLSSAAITAMGLSEVGPLYGAIGWGYVASASFAVVYLGEHYVADVLVGLLVAEAVRRAEPYAGPFVRAVARTVQ